MKWLVICHREDESEGTYTCTLEANSEQEVTELAASEGLIVDMCLPADEKDEPEFLARVSGLDPSDIRERLESKRNEMRVLDFLADHLGNTANACAEGLHSDEFVLTGFPSARDRNARARATLELHVFGLYQISHAMLHANHDRSAWEKVIEHCAARLCERFETVSVEGGDMMDFIGVRVNQYGDWTRAVLRTPQDQPDLIDGWLRMLRNNVAAAWTHEVLHSTPAELLIADPRYTESSKKVTIRIPGAIASYGLEIAIQASFFHLFYAVLNRPVTILCETVKNIFDLTWDEFENTITECFKKAGSEESNEPTKKKRSWWSRILRRG